MGNVSTSLRGRRSKGTEKGKGERRENDEGARGRREGRYCFFDFFYAQILIVKIVIGSRDGAVVRALASHQCGPRSIPGPNVICGLSLLLVLSLLREVFLRVLRFSPLLKNQHCQIPIRSGMHGHMLNELLSALKAGTHERACSSRNTLPKHASGYVPQPVHMKDTTRETNPIGAWELLWMKIISQFDWPTGDTSCHGKQISVHTRDLAPETDSCNRFAPGACSLISNQFDTREQNSGAKVLLRSICFR